METDRLNLKLLRSDKFALKEMADSEGEPMSVIVRRLLRKELSRCGFLEETTPPIERKNSKKVIHNN